MIKVLLVMAGLVTIPAFIVCAVSLLVVWAWTMTGQVYGSIGRGVTGSVPEQVF